MAIRIPDVFLKACIETRPTISPGMFLLKLLSWSAIGTPTLTHQRETRGRGKRKAIIVIVACERGNDTQIKNLADRGPTEQYLSTLRYLLHYSFSVQTDICASVTCLILFFLHCVGCVFFCAFWIVQLDRCALNALHHPPNDPKHHHQARQRNHG